MHGATATLVAQLSKVSLLFGSQLLLARLLLPAEFGLIAMVGPVLYFVMAINDLGLGQATIQRADITRQQLSSLFWLNAAASGCLMLLVMLAAPLIAWAYRESRVTDITIALASLIFVSGLSVQPLALLNRQMRFISLAIIDLVSVVLGVAVGIVAALSGMSYWSLVLMQVTNSLTGLILSWCVVRWRPSWPAREPGVGSLLQFGAHLSVGNIALYVSTSADNVLVGIASGKLALGLYDRSYRLVAQPLTLLLAPASRVAIPLLSRIHDEQQYQKIYLQMVRVTMLVCTPGLVVNMFLAEPVVVLLLGRPWQAMAPIFAWISFGGIASAVYASTVWLFTTQNRTRQQMHYAILTSGINVVSFAIGIYWGAVGVAGVGAVSFVIMQTPMMMWAATREGPVTLRSVGRAVVPFVAAAIAAAIAVCAIKGALDWQRPSLLIAAAVVASYAVFAGIVACFSSGRECLGSIINVIPTLARQGATCQSV